MAKDAILEGYSTINNISQEDLEILPYFILTQQLVMLAWLNDRRDNPSIAKRLDKAVTRNMQEFRKILVNGLNPNF